MLGAARRKPEKKRAGGLASDGACYRHSVPEASSIKPHDVAYPTRSRDTDPQAEAVQLEIYRRMPAGRKIQLVFEAIDLSRAVARAGIRGRQEVVDVFEELEIPYHVGGSLASSECKTCSNALSRRREAMSFGDAMNPWFAKAVVLR